MGACGIAEFLGHAVVGTDQENLRALDADFTAVPSGAAFFLRLHPHHFAVEGLPKQAFVQLQGEERHDQQCHKRHGIHCQAGVFPGTEPQISEQGIRGEPCQNEQHRIHDSAAVEGTVGGIHPAVEGFQEYFFFRMPEFIRAGRLIPVCRRPRFLSGGAFPVFRFLGLLHGDFPAVSCTITDA